MAIDCPNNRDLQAMMWDEIWTLVFSEQPGARKAVDKLKPSDAYIIGKYVISLGTKIDAFVNSTMTAKTPTPTITDKAFPDVKIQWKAPNGKTDTTIALLDSGASGLYIN
jgi:hypothetical protein